MPPHDDAYAQLIAINHLSFATADYECKKPHELRRSPLILRHNSHTSCAIHPASRFLDVLTHR